MKIEYVAPVADITYFDIKVLLNDGSGIPTPEDSWVND